MNRIWTGLILLQALPALAASDLVAHEWGTFTSLQGSNGKVVEGLQHEEEGLPGFVYSRNRLNPSDHSAFARMAVLGDDPQPQPQPTPEPTPKPPRPWPRPCRPRKGFECGELTAVTQKLETPVIYFYSPRAQHVNVDVEFPSGIISQWYPNAESFRPDIGLAGSLTNGAMSWSVDIGNTPLDLPFVSPHDIWAPSRQVHSAFVKVGSENERFIFYRGLGHFDVPFEVWSTGEAGLVATNHSEQPIAAAFLLRVRNGQGVVQALGAVPAHGSVATTIPTAALPLEEYVVSAQRQLRVALEASGLYADEAEAMVHTWSKSYFRTPGTRILYVVPRDWTDKLLPIHVTPEPSSLVRTLVGRVEVFSAAEERETVAALEKAAHGGAPFDLAPFGRFAEAKIRRALELTSDPATHKLGEKLITALQ